MTLNVRGLNDKTKRQQVFYWLRKQEADVIALQETHLGKACDEWKWTREWEGQSYWSVVSSNCKGVALLFNRKRKFDVTNVQKGQSGRIISLSAKVEDKNVRFVCVYAPNKENERKAFFKSDLEDHMDSEQYNVLLGDFNCTLEDVDRSHLNNGGIEVGRAELSEFMKKKQLFDVYRRRNPRKKEFTYFKPNSTVRSRIDCVMLDEMMDPWVYHVQTQTAVFSDHNAVIVKLKVGDQQRGPGRWKMSARIIESRLFSDTFSEFWQSWSTCKDQFSSKRMWWVETKDKIKELATWCARQINKKERGDRKRLEDLLLEENNKAEPNLGEIETLRSQLEEINRIKCDGARVRAGVKWFEEGETSSAYFHGLEKQRTSQRAWSSIKTKTGDIKEGIDIILETQQEFYRDLYRKVEINQVAATELLDKVQTRIEDGEKEICEANIVYEEVESVIKSSRKGCSPGIDGIINEFYQIFWPVIGRDFLEVVNEIEQSGELAPSQNMGVITLLYKSGERTDLKNWRPITVLNSDYKIIEKVLSTRLKLVLERIIHSDQKAYLRNRQIGENVRLNEDIIYYCENYNKPGAVIYIDQSKAFDRVSQQWVQMVLERYGFGEQFRKWIDILYTNARSTIFTNGFLSESVQIERGVRQGSPLGPYLYILQSEPFAEAIRQDPSIEGIKIREASGNVAEIKIAAFADDTQGYTSTMESIDRWVYHLEVYSEASGAVINVDKTGGTRLGTLKNDHSRDHLIKWEEGPIKALGVNQGINKQEREYWQKKIVKMKQKLNHWKMRNLTLMGKTYLLKSVGLSTLLYAVDLQSVPEYVKNEINGIIWNFIWNDKNDKVKRDICMRTIAEGGIAAPNLDGIIDVCRLKMLSKILEEGNENWKMLPRFFLGMGTGRCVLQCKVDNRKMPMFYKECTEAWYKVRCEKKPKLKTVIDLLIPQGNDNVTPQKLELKCGDVWRDIAGMTKAEVKTAIRGENKRSNNEIKWTQQYPNIDWAQVYATLSQKTIERKVREFQWKIINFAVYTEQRLKHIAFTDGKCCLCASEDETLTHMLVDCDTVSEFWTAVIILIRKNVPCFMYREEYILVGCTNVNSPMSKDETEIANFMIQNAKWTTWKRRCVMRYEGIFIPQMEMWNMFFVYTKRLLNMEKYIMSTKCKQLFKKAQIE